MTLPFSAKASLLLIGFYVLISMLYIGQGIILPIIYATIFAISISPAVNFFVKHKMNRALSISLVLTIAFLVISAIIVILSAQASLLSNAYPTLVGKFQVLFNQTIIWVSTYSNLSVENINDWIDNGTDELLNNSNSAIGLTLTRMGGFLSVAFLTPVYVFMLLFYQEHLLTFIHRLFAANNDDKVSEILIKTKTIVQSYLVGLFFEFAIIAALNVVCLMILGIKYAILFGIIGALLNVIPYIGGIIAVGLFMIVAFVTKTPIYALYVLIVMDFIVKYRNPTHFNETSLIAKVLQSLYARIALLTLNASFLIFMAALWSLSIDNPQHAHS